MERLFYNKVNGEWIPRIQPTLSALDMRERVRKTLAALCWAKPRGRCEEWAKFPTYYTGPKRKLYERVVKSLISKPFNVVRDATISTFVKFEKYLKVTSPRLIQPRDPRFNVVLGCFIKQIEGKIFHRIDKLFGGKTVMSGYNADEVAQHIRVQWDKVKDPVTFDLDVERFDQKCSALVQEVLEHPVYLSYFSNDEREFLRELLMQTLFNRATARCSDGVVKYSVIGSRMSGDMTTKVGNTIIVSVIIHSWLLHLGLDPKKIGFVLVGDDGQLIVPRELCNMVKDGLGEWFREFGFTVKLGPTTSTFESISFCQSHPIDLGGTYTMVRHLTALRKDVAFLKKAGADEYNGWVHAMGTAGRILSQGVPVFSSWYAMYQGVESGVALDPESGLARLARGLHERSGLISDRARVSFYDAFGIYPDEQIAAERWLEKHQIPLWGEVAAFDWHGCPEWLRATGIGA
jgi:hypothetical protein